MWLWEVLILILVFLAAWNYPFWRYLYLILKIPNSSFRLSYKSALRFFHGDNKAILEEINKGFEIKGLTTGWIGPVAMINITTPEDAQIVMNAKECADKPYFMKLFGRPQSSLFGDIDSWRSHRKILNPFFSNNALRTYIPMFNEKVKVMMRNIRKMEGRGLFDVFDFGFALSLDTTLCSMGLNIDVQSMSKEILDNYFDNLEIYGQCITSRIVRPWLHPRLLFEWSSVARRQKEALTVVDGFTSEIIKRASETIAEKDQNKKAKTFVSALVDPANGLTTSEITDEINALVLAALDTTVNMASAVMLLLAMQAHKDKQAKVLAELQQVFGAWNENLYVDIEQLNQLEYLEMVINEAMRLIPALPFVCRTNDEEIVLSDKYVIPPNSNLVVHIMHLHRRKDLWGEDVEEFRPERFEKENFSKIHSYAYIPFARGARMCIGYRYAMNLMKIQLANVLLKYEVDTSVKLADLEFRFVVTLNLCQGYMISIKERDSMTRK